MSEVGLRDSLIRQFARSWKMVEEAIRSFSAEEWKTGDVTYLTPARLAYHIVETAEFYSGETADGFSWGHRFGCDWESAAPDDLPTQEAVLAYLADARSQVENWLREVDLFAPDAAFDWTGGCALDRALYLVRHNHHHVGEMWSEIKRRGHPLPDWY
jgi:hypothetical protein